MKTLIVCCDGTWNTLKEEQDDIPIPTNVGKLYFALDKLDKTNIQQLSYYHPGVGTNPSINDKFFGGAFGDGLDKNIKSAYRWICDHYAKGDKLYLFGFSRGAYTARSLGGFLSRCGLLELRNLSETDSWLVVEKAYSEGYRKKSTNWLGSSELNIIPEEVVIDFIGVWDTVGSLGIPDNLSILNLFDNISNHNFHDTGLSDKVKVARHAIALDEKRASFSPTLWTDIPAECDVKQTWFPGAHCDVGGGYPQTGLSDGALKWMIDEATKLGLSFNVNKFNQISPKYQDVLHDSYKGIYKYLGSKPRSIPPIDDMSVHESAKDRHKSPPITEYDYKPTHYIRINETNSLSIYAAQEWNDTGIYMKAGEVYQFEAMGEWIDGSIKIRPDGSDDGMFHFGNLVHYGLDILGKAENFWKHITKNPNANQIFTKREEEYSWFSLIGVIANGGNLPVSSSPEKHETFLIGNGVTYVVKKSGYFFAFANDAWNYYYNNRGSVSLLITRNL